MFSLSSLMPEREPFDLGDGRVIHFRTKDDFDLAQLAAWMRLIKTMGDVQKMREKAGSSEEMHQRASEKSRVAALEIIGLGLPDLPHDIIDSLTAGQIDHLAAICIPIIGGTYKSGAPDDKQREAVRQRYPALPDGLIATLTMGQVALLLEGDEVAAASNPK